MSQLKLPDPGRWAPRACVQMWETEPFSPETEAKTAPAAPEPARNPPKAGPKPPRNGLKSVRNLRVFDPNLLACECGAKLTQACRTEAGNVVVDHSYRLVSRRCVCGETLAPRKQYCETCRLAARKRTERLRELRTPTKARRKGAM